MEGLLFLFGLFFSSATFLFNCVCSKVTYHGCGEGRAWVRRTGAESGKDIGNLFYDPSSATVCFHPDEVLKKQESECV